MSDHEGVVYTNDEGVATIRFNRPATLNALRAVDILRVGELLREIAVDEGVRVVVLTGTGRAFTSGEDLNELSAHLDGDEAQPGHEAHLDRFQDLTRLLLSLPQPTVAAINGVAVGVGAELSLACDIRIAAQSARFGFPEVTRGLLGTNGVFKLLPRVAGSGPAAYLLLSGEIVDAATVAGFGILAPVVADEEFPAAVAALTKRLASNATLSMRLTKRLLVDEPGLDLEGVLAREAEGMAACLFTPDIREGTTAFLEDRPAAFGAS
ncbi:enoyl-CoA hydratase/isomerase family protein [Jiangella anatolica]|uniref:enoyl-CoA hydratase/isomerase family protein n=1 Tax=Jiangella anatolica TaxID=2670374 RepID=UPI001313DFBA|nr:enoyl-CoA hydratase-related protein [Jiangella anatolica]